MHFFFFWIGPGATISSCLSVGVTVKQPGLSVTTKQPAMVTTAKQPAISTSAKQPAVIVAGDNG